MSQFTKKVLAAAIVGGLCFAGAAKAATVSMVPVVTGYWNSSAHVGGPFDPTPANNKDAGIYKVEMKLSTSNLSSTDTTAGFTGFGNVAFDVTFNNSHAVNSADVPGWLKYNPTVTSNGSKASYSDEFGTPHSDGTGVGGGPLYSADDDLGSSSSDLKFITTDVGAGQFAADNPRLLVGQSTQNSHMTNILGNPISVGAIYVQFDGSAAGSTLQLANTLPGEGFSLHNNTTGQNQVVTGLAGQTLSLGSVAFGAVPEPTSLALLGLAAGGAMIRRRRA